MGPPQGPSARCAITVDKFSALPFDLAHRILSPLPLADFARLSCLSKGLRAFHLSNPIVKFTGFPSESICTYNRRLDLLNCLDRFFILRGNNQIQSFSLHWLCNYRVGEVEFVSRFGDEKSRIIGWLQNAVSCNVESLTIFFRALMLHDCTLPMDICLPFPCCVFDCESLRSLIVDMRCTVLKASSFATSHVSNLVCMMLTNITFEDDKWFCKWVSISCRFLKELLIDHVNGLEYITIESSSLESFSRNSGSSCRALQLTCPNLKSLKWVGYSLPINLFMGEFNCLEEVEISFSNPEVDYARADFISARDNLLRSICSVKALVLDPITVEILFKGGSPHAPFLNLWSLHVRIHESICNATVPALAALLNGASNLNTLDISSKSPKISNGIQAFGYAKGYWAKPGLLDFTSQLKEVTLELTNGSNGIALAWHILKHAQNLKKMIIICFPILPHHYNFLMKLEGTKIISNATITIQRN